MTFNRGSVILMYVNIMALPIVCFKLESYPPKVFVICWFVFWTVQALITVQIHVTKKKNKQTDKILEEAKKYITEDNVASVVKHSTGIKIGEKNNDENYK